MRGHSLRRTEATPIYRRTENPRAVQLPLGNTKIECTARYLGHIQVVHEHVDGTNGIVVLHPVVEAFQQKASIGSDPPRQ